MEKFLKRGPQNASTSQPSKRIEVCPRKYPDDPALRPKITEYSPNERVEVKRYYLQKGPSQPKVVDFKQVEMSGLMRKFNPSWFKEFGSWLEYSEYDGGAYCLYCYLFNENKQGGNTFITEGFKSWNKKDILIRHIGGPNSFHNQAMKKCDALENQKLSIRTFLTNQTEQSKHDYCLRMKATITTARLLLHQGLPFRGHDESENSHNKGNFLEFLKVYSKANEEMSKVVKNAPKNSKMICPETQKDIANASAKEVLKAITDDVEDDLFGILVDESCDISDKEQMAVLLRYVDKRGSVLERFIGIVHVSDTTASSLKEAICTLLSSLNLSLSRVRGQGYDGASNMRGSFNGLKSLILRENPSAYYIHCFAHQLQLALVYVARRSAKRRDLFREKQSIKIIEELSHDNLETGKGLNQELGLRRPGDTRWGSHYGSVLNLIATFSCVIEMLQNVRKDSPKQEQKTEANRLVKFLQDFDFVFLLHLMKNVLGITNELSLALQRKDQDIENAMSLVKVAKDRLQALRDNGLTYLLDEVSSFFMKHEINIPNMEDRFVLQRKSAHKAPHITHLHRYRVDIFCAIIYTQLQELNSRFDEINSELLLCVAFLNPRDSFQAFDNERLVKLASFYPREFSNVDLLALPNQLENFIVDVRTMDKFSNLNGLSELASVMVQTNKHIAHPQPFLLLKLALILLVATASVERIFSAMKFIKDNLRNKMCDEWMNDCLITYVEKELFERVSDGAILRRFQKMKDRRIPLSDKECEI